MYRRDATHLRSEMLGSATLFRCLQMQTLQLSGPAWLYCWLLRVVDIEWIQILWRQLGNWCINPAIGCVKWHNVVAIATAGRPGFCRITGICSTSINSKNSNLQGIMFMERGGGVGGDPGTCMHFVMAACSPPLPPGGGCSIRAAMGANLCFPTIPGKGAGGGFLGAWAHQKHLSSLGMAHQLQNDVSSHPS
jgi:hypothetical protein